MANWRPHPLRSRQRLPALASTRPRTFAPSLMTESLPTKKGEPADEARAAAEFSVWEGVYGSFVEASAVGPGFHGPTWRDRSIEAAREAIAKLKTDEPLDSHYANAIQFCRPLLRQC